MSSYYGQSWDMYVTSIFDRSKREDSVFPGDEWGNVTWWNIVYERLLERAGAKTWKKVVEIGSGSGKYTNLLLARSECSILAFDVSAEFLRVLESRCAPYIEGGRLIPALLSCKQPDEMLSKIEELGWRGTVDTFFSLDAMVHVDLQYLVTYCVTAGICLRPGGKLIMTLANATSPRGQQKLLEDIKLYYPMQGEISLKFEFVSPDILRSVLQAIGFKIDLLENDSPDPAQARDIFLIATSASCDADTLEGYLR
jgi:SAM-dependent methyltransferase